MAVSRTEFVIKTLMFCLILFTLTISASVLAITARDGISEYEYDYNPVYGNKSRKDNATETEYDITDGFARVAEIFTMYNLPMPFPIIFTIWNAILLSTIVYCIAEILRMWIWGMPGG